MKPPPKRSPSAKNVVEALGRGTVHPFPARMAPGIALEALADAKRPLRVLDPMMGSGTVLAVARSKGHRAYGTDLDPLAVLISRVWTTSVSERAVVEAADRALARAQKSVRASGVSYPPGVDAETREFMRYWFDKRARCQLVALAAAIRSERVPQVRDALWCALSRLVITKQGGASLAMDLSHSRPHRAFVKAPMLPFDGFLAAASLVAKNCPAQGKSPIGPATVVRRADARALPIADGSIDLVLTSPPYLNAIDYLRCSKFSLVWMGYSVTELREVRSRSVGTEASTEEAAKDEAADEVFKSLKLESKLPKRQERLLRQFIFDMRQGLAEVARVLAKDGRAVYVVGDNTVRGTFVRNSSIVKLVGQQAGLNVIGTRTRKLPPNRRYLPPPTANRATLDGRMSREVVVSFALPKRRG